MNTLFLLQQTTTQVADTLVSNSAAIPATTVEKLSILDLVFAPASLWIMIPLFIEMAMVIYILVERWLALKSAGKDERNFMNNIRDFIHNGKIESAISLCKGTDTLLSRMIEKGLSRLGKPLEDVSAAIENTGKLEISKLENRLSTLATIAGTAPMLGFLGTVTGMIVAFHAMSANPNNLNVSLLADGIYTALICTVAGLVVSITAHICYNFIVSKITNLVNMLEAQTIEFMDLLHEPI